MAKNFQQLLLSSTSHILFQAFNCNTKRPKNYFVCVVRFQKGNLKLEGRREAGAIKND